MKPYKQYIIFVLLLLALLCMVAFFTSCEVLKTKRRVATDSTSVKTIDTTHKATVDAGRKGDSTWWKETIYLSHDTNIYHNTTTVPVNNYYPTQIVREGGTVSKEEWLRMLDSVNAVKKDTVSVQKVEETKDKKSGVSPMLLFFVGMGFLLLCAVVGFILIFRLTNVIKTKL